MLTKGFDDEYERAFSVIATGAGGVNTCMIGAMGLGCTGIRTGDGFGPGGAGSKDG